MELLIWLGIGFCVTQSAMFSGLNLAFFSISKLRLEIEASKNNRNALKVLSLRRDSNFLLTTILWGNVGVNVLLALLSNSVLTGIVAFVFSTVIITFIGEIVPQAYFSRHALKMASLLSPALRFYQILLFPAAKPTALILDKWLGAEAVQYFQETDLQELIEMHITSDETDIERVEGRGALNFLAIDDLLVAHEGEPVEPRTIISLRFEQNKPIFPNIEPSTADNFLKSIHLAEKKWVIITDLSGEPKMVLDSDGFIGSALFGMRPFNPYLHCHRPIIVKDVQARLGEIIPHLKVHPEQPGDDVIDEDIILFWDKQKRVITGSDILGRLLRGIVQQESVPFQKLIHGKA
jgi:metal transporter CNNM